MKTKKQKSFQFIKYNLEAIQLEVDWNRFSFIYLKKLCVRQLKEENLYLQKQCLKLAVCHHKLYQNNFSEFLNSKVSVDRHAN